MFMYILLILRELFFNRGKWGSVLNIWCFVCRKNRADIFKISLIRIGQYFVQRREY